MNKFLNEFIDRGFFYQCTNKEELSNILDKKKLMHILGLIVLRQVYMLVVCCK